MLDEINSMYEDHIIWENDGYFKKFVVLKAKNYIMDDGKNIKYKGSSIKDSKKEPVLKELMHEVIGPFIRWS